MSTLPSSTWPLAGGSIPPQGGGGHGSMHWGLLVGVPLIALGLLLAGCGLVLAVKLARTATKPVQHLLGPFFLLLGAGIAGLGFWLA
ncbi:hypothetical protein [Streptacidiphilus anmyonensis]|uniref:hypothetical protein n=1 Tax=Streptacidiphilus anmyonensis TaxID=405782 RepID=UPI0005A717D9|nr:hypothetical protein [Streptacidiphilus anmyonensis]